VASRGFKGGGRNHADEFAACDFDASFSAFFGDSVEDGVKRGGFEIDEVDGDLDFASRFEGQAEGFDRFEASARFADLAGDGLGGVKVRGAEVDVPGDEEFSGADDAGSGSGVAAFADIGRKALGGEFADVFEPFAFGAESGGFVEIDGDFEFAPDAMGNGAGNRGAVLKADRIDTTSADPSLG
jgi:hypothetical protein